jgi:plasmid maintenance system antidote protein VapI
MRRLYGNGATRSRSGDRVAGPAAAGQVTIQDVARAVGVGRQTVSNVLNGSGRVLRTH